MSTITDFLQLLFQNDVVCLGLGFPIDLLHVLSPGTSCVGQFLHVWNCVVSSNISPPKGPQYEDETTFDYAHFDFENGMGVGS